MEKCPMPVTEKGYTASDISREAGVPLHRVQYVARSRNVEPNQRVGNLRLFSESDRQFMLSELRRIQGDRRTVHA